MSEIYLFRGFSTEEIDKGKAILASRKEDLGDMVFLPASSAMLGENVEALLNRIDSAPPARDDDAAGSKAVIMATGSQEKALRVMRAFKAAMADPGEAAFAMVTRTSLAWTLGYYMDHVTKEHIYMKTHNPAEDPDMKKIN